MAKANQSLVTLTPPTWNQTVSWTSAATSSGTKKIRRIVSVFGRFIAQTNYIKSVTEGSCLSGGVLYLNFAHESIAPPFLPRQSCTAPARRQEAAGRTTQCPADPGGRTAHLDSGMLRQPGSAHAEHRPAGADRHAVPEPLRLRAGGRHGARRAAYRAHHHATQGCGRGHAGKAAGRDRVR